MAASMIRSTGSSELPTKAAALLAERILSTPVLSSDIAIISACAQFDALEREYAAVNLANEDSPRLDEIYAAQSPLVGLIGRTAATTAEGVRAKARSLALWDSSLMAEGTGDAGKVLMGSILRDLLGGSNDAVAGDTDPDAAILAACENVRDLRRQRDQKPDLPDEPYFELMKQHRAAMLEVVRLQAVTSAGRRAIAGLILEERDLAQGNALTNKLFNHDLSERAAEAWVEAMAAPTAPAIEPGAQGIV